ncbi:MAG: Crp/Fnr family transcriptional regulator [Anderseniella sp.]
MKKVSLQHIIAVVDEIRDIPLFATLGEGDARRLSVHCVWRSVAENELIIDYEDETAEVLFVVDGRVRVLLRTASGREVILDDMQGGRYFGEMAAIDGLPRSANVTALEKTRICVMPDAVFRDACTTIPSVGLSVMKMLADRVRTLNQRLGEYAFLTAKQRLCAELLRLSRPRMGNEKQRIVSPPPLQRELADRISTQREVVTRELASLSRKNVVEKTRGGLVLVEPDRLNAIIDEAQSK